MPDPLVQVRRASRARKRAEEAYKSALQAARDAGLPASKIGAAAGTTRQNVLTLTERPTAAGGQQP